MPKGRRLERWTLDRLLLVASGAAAAIISLLDLAGVLEISAISNKIPQLTLLVGSLVLTVVAVNFPSSAARLSQRIEALRDQVVEDSKKNSASLERLEKELSKSQLEAFPTLIEQVNPALLRIFRPYLEASFRTPPRVLLESRFQLQDLESYRSYHRRAHEANPGSVFLATSLPYRKWFWMGDYVERTIENFIADGGRIVRIFFLHSAQEVLENLEVQETLSIQAKFGVEVWIIVASSVPATYRRFFLVDEQKTFGWEAIRGPDDRVVSINVTANRSDTEAFHEIFEQLRRMATRYRPGEIMSQQIGAEGHMQVNIAKDQDAFREFEYSGWQGAVEKYHAAWGGLTMQAAAPMLDVLSVTQGIKLLDVATGPGYVAARAAERGADVTGVDFSPEMIRKATSLNPSVVFREADAENLPFEADIFDAVSMNFGMLHLGNPELAMKEAFRVLKKGGRFAFTVWAPPQEAVGFEVILKAVAESGGHVPVPHGPDFFYYSRPEECRIALTTVGFTAPNVMLLDLTWRLPTVEDLFPAFLQGTARTGGLLRRQEASNRAKIAERVRETAMQFVTSSGELVIPMPAILAWGERR